MYAEDRPVPPASDAYIGLGLHAATNRIAHLLARVGVESAERDARLLFAAATGTDTRTLLLHPERKLTQREGEVLAGYVRRRFVREPVSRILGRRGFYGLDFAISAATLDPRPCSETVVETALEIAGREGWRQRPVSILDLGTGSGCLLIALLDALPHARGAGVDLDPAALAIARRNAEAAGVADRTSFLEHDFRRGLPTQGAPFQLVISNPPYIRSADIATLDREVRDFDPRLALDGGADGLEAYRAIAGALKERSADWHWAVLEVGAGQAAEVAQILGQAAIGEALVRRDLGGHSRCVAVQSHSPKCPQ